MLNSFETFTNGKSSELFFSALDTFLLDTYLLDGGRIVMKDIDCWVAITGPGSFTGIRICIAALTAVSLALGKELKGLSSLDAAALLSGKEKLHAASRLKLSEFAVRQYDFVDKIYSPVRVEILGEDKSKYILINSGQTDTEGYTNLTVAVADPRCGEFFQEAAPIYVRPSEAEINFDKKSIN